MFFLFQNQLNTVPYTYKPTIFLPLQVKDIKEANIVKAVPTQNNGYPELVKLEHVEVIRIFIKQNSSC